MRRRTAKGQAILLVVVAMGIFMVGALGLAIDGGQLYGHRQMAQSAADAAAQAGILSIFNGTNVGTNSFGSAAYTCSTTNATTPCAFARKNGFGATTDDTVAIDFPSAATVGLDPASLSADAVNILRVTITRQVRGTIIRMLGAAATTNIKAIGVAAIVNVESPVPMVITHPSLDSALYANGNTGLKICGGPTQSIQVNSSSLSAFVSKGGGTVDLSQAGPADPGNCSTGTGADFGVFGGPLTPPGTVQLGSTGNYRVPSSVVEDPFRNVPAPAVPSKAAAPQTVVFGQFGCAYPQCTLYSPGLYPGGLSAKNDNILFKPGLYYMQGGGFTLKNVNGGGGAPAFNTMCVGAGCSNDPDTGAGIVVYDSGPAGSKPGNNPTGGFDTNTGVSVTMQGATVTTTNSKGETVPGPPYYGILFWEDRDADAHAHSLGSGNGCFSLTGTIYITNWKNIMAVSPGSHYQAVSYAGNPCSSTMNQGFIVVSTLEIKGSSIVKMKLLPYGFMKIRQVALVH